MKKCCFPGCGAVLRNTNKGCFCDYHRRLLICNDVIYHERKYYKGEASKKYSLINKEQVLKLKMVIMR